MKVNADWRRQPRQFTRIATAVLKGLPKRRVANWRKVKHGAKHVWTIPLDLTTPAYVKGATALLKAAIEGSDMKAYLVPEALQAVEHAVVVQDGHRAVRLIRFFDVISGRMETNFTVVAI